jgi:hypothetical protein
MPLDKPLEDIAEVDLTELITQSVCERKTIEYKEALPSNSDADKKEFLADVSSFANAAGGYIIYGMREKSGVAVELSGLQVIADTEVLRLESSIRDGIAPRIPGVHSKPLDLANGKVAIVMRVPKSFASPHMVTHKGTSRFFSRTSNGKYPLDVTEIRSAFLLSESIGERIRNFRLERIARIVGGETPVPIEAGAKIVLHLIPLSAFGSVTQVDLGKVPHVHTLLAPLYRKQAWDSRFNFDGYVVYRHGDLSNYLQLFRSGVIETVDSSYFGVYEGKKIIPSINYEKDLIQKLPTYVEAERRIGVEAPFVVMLSLLGVLGYTMGVSGRWFANLDAPRQIDRDNLVLPEVYIESSGFDAGLLMKPVFDAIWNAAGWEGSINYDANNKWVGPPLR